MDTELVHPFSPTLSEESQATTTLVEDIPEQTGSPENDDNKPTAPPAELMLAPQPQERVKSGDQPALKEFYSTHKSLFKTVFTQ